MPNAKVFRLSLLVIFAGCTTQPNTGANNGPDVVCHSEQEIGSLITRSICTTRAQRAEQQAQLDEVKRTVASDAGNNTRPSVPKGP